MSQDPETPDKPAAATAESVSAAAAALGSHELDLRVRLGSSGPRNTGSVRLGPPAAESPMTQAFNRIGDRDPVLPTSLPFMGTSPVSYTTYRGNDGQIHQDGKRGIEYRVEGGDVRLMAGSFVPTNAGPGQEYWTADVAWTPINMSGLRVGPMLGDVARSDMSEGAARPFERVGVSVGLYATTDGKDGGLLARVQTDPLAPGKIRAFVGLKVPFNGQ